LTILYIKLIALLKAMEVSQAGDIANFMIPGKLLKGQEIFLSSSLFYPLIKNIPGIGGAMDLVSNPDKTKVIAVMEHCSKNGKPKILSKCSLPLTGARAVSTIITELAVFEVDRVAGEMELTDIAEGVTVDQVRAKTGADFKVRSSLGSF
jgi:3-oxoacid CoA-transferase